MSRRMPPRSSPRARTGGCSTALRAPRRQPAHLHGLRPRQRDETKLVPYVITSLLRGRIAATVERHAAGGLGLRRRRRRAFLVAATQDGRWESGRRRLRRRYACARPWSSEIVRLIGPRRRAPIRGTARPAQRAGSRRRRRTTRTLTRLGVPSTAARPGARRDRRVVHGTGERSREDPRHRPSRLHRLGPGARADDCAGTTSSGSTRSTTAAATSAATREPSTAPATDVRESGPTTSWASTRSSTSPHCRTTHSATSTPTGRTRSIGTVRSHSPVLRRRPAFAGSSSLRPAACTARRKATGRWTRTRRCAR